MSPEINFEKLEAFALGKLNSKESAEIRQTLSSDADLQKELTVLKLSIQGIRMSGKKEQIKNIQSSYLDQRKEERTPIIPFWTWTRALAASLLFFVVASVIFTLSYVTPSSFDTKFQSYELPVMRAETQQTTVIQDAYSQKNYQQVIALASTAEPLPTKDLFLLGMSYLNLDLFEQAQTTFTALEDTNQKTGQGIYADEVDFYMVEISIQLKNYAAAQERISKIKGDLQHPYRYSFSLWDRVKIQILDWKN